MNATAHDHTAVVCGVSNLVISHQSSQSNVIRFSGVDKVHFFQIWIPKAQYVDLSKIYRLIYDTDFSSENKWALLS